MKPYPILILAASIASLLVSSSDLTPTSTPARPVAAFGDIVAGDVVDFTARDLPRLRGNVVRALVRKSPYVDVLPGGTLEAGIADIQRVVIQERAVLNQSLVRPTFTLDKEMCGQNGPAAEVGSKEYEYKLETNRGRGPLVCIKGMWGAFKTAYTAAEDALKKSLIQLNNADVRIMLVDRSGCKMVVQAGATFDAMFDGTMQQIDTPFANVGLPNAQPTIKLLQYLGQFMREDLLVDPFEGKSGEMVMKFIGSQNVIDALRDDAQVREDHRYIAAGSYDVGKMTLTRYTWEGPYRGIAFGIDPQPLRFNLLNGSGQPVYIEPEIAVDTDNGVASHPNPAWVRAKYEVALFMGQDSFRKLTPETYTGEGTFKFPSQTVTGEMIWRNVLDNDQNVWQDYGRHHYQFSRAYKPERPHAVCALAYARSTVDFGLTSITSYPNWSSTAAL